MINKTFKNLSPSTSIVLDLLRIFAAFFVLLCHAHQHWFPSQPLTNELDNIAHFSVIIFFVLSGYVIAYTTSKNINSGTEYFISRFSRLYSVVFPALIITAGIQIFSSIINPRIMSLLIRGHSFPRYILSGLFSNELWFLSSAPPINSPLWSLSYEFWFYVIFGLFFYYSNKNGFKSYIPGVIALLIAGPKILLLMPVWLLGYFAYKRPPLIIKKSISWTVVILLFLIAILVDVLIPPYPHKLGGYPFYFSYQFLTDWLEGIIVALFLYFLPTDGRVYKTPNLVKLVRNLADLTFPVYVLHKPLLILWDVLFHSIKITMDTIWIPVISVIVTSCLIGLILEKYKRIWKDFFRFIFSKINRFNLKYYKRSSEAEIIPD